MIPLSEAIGRLRDWELVLRDTLQVAARALLHVASFRQKVVAGELVGAIGSALATVDRRLLEMDHDGLPRTRKDEQPAISDIAPRITALQAAVTERACDLAVADRPTAWMAEALSVDLDRVLRCLAEASTVADPAIDAGASMPLPNRDEHLAFGDADYVDAPMATLLASDDGRSRLLHYICLDIEIAASEVCAQSIVDGVAMPSAFLADLARQCWDEARHSQLLADRMRELGLEIGTYRADGSVWRRYHTGSTLRERLAIQHVVLEGNGLDSGMALVNQFRAAGDESTAAIFEFLLADEVNHVRLGNRWISWLAEHAGDYATFIHDAASRIGVTVPGSAAPDRALRLAAGFPAWFLDLLLDPTAVPPLQQEIEDIT